MPEKLLNLAQVRSHVEKVRRVTVAQSVRMNPVHQASFPCSGCEDTTDVARTESPDDPRLRLAA